ncbi:DNA/RNA non-specific endonuclease [Streptomyces lydicus]|uniref:DNA/RNA non-specific endonuclease n=1 Tax=Streptomyces lydicus TaxID=47763 RepID=UPI00378B2804
MGFKVRGPVGRACHQYCSPLGRSPLAGEVLPDAFAFTVDSHHPKRPNPHTGHARRGHRIKILLRALGAQLGGSNRDSRNFVTMHAYANSPVMRNIENQVRAAAEKGETIQCSVTPVYDGSNPIPKGVSIEAHGSNGFQFTQHKSIGISGSALIPNEKIGT